MADNTATEAVDIIEPAGDNQDTERPRELSYEEYPTALKVSEGLRQFVDRIGRFGSWFILPLILITVFDVTARKLIWIQIWLVEHVGRIFESTLLQELEWHAHTTLFALVLGYGYIWNTHVRVDLVREHLGFRKKAWIELFGLTFFLIPYISIVIWFAGEYAYSSWEIGEISASQVGLTNRWIIKSVLLVGLVIALLAGIAVWLQIAIALWGPQNVRFPLMTVDWPERTGATIEGKERLDLEKAKDELVERAKRSGHLSDPTSDDGPAARNAEK